jgi:ABC-2 type transport system ATP-binding protein
MSIKIQNLTKCFGSVIALDNVSLTLEPNKIYGLLGRNGAGKTTLLNVITNRLFADTGSVYIDSYPTVENDHAQGLIYMMGEQTLFPDSMKVKDAFYWTKQFYPAFDSEYAEKLSQTFQLKTSKAIKSLSTGYLSIFKLILALSVNTPYVIFDEPVLGLDANHRELFYRLLIEKYTQNPFTVILSTHLIEEVSNLIERIVIINKGKVVQDTTTEKLLKMGYTVSGKAESVDRFISGKNCLDVTALGGLKIAYVLGEQPESIENDLEVSKLDLQKLFVKLTEEREDRK